MRFSLRSRFRGAFLGAALGQIFGTIALSQSQLTRSRQAHSRQGQFSQPDPVPPPKQPDYDFLPPAQVWKTRSDLNFALNFAGTHAGKQAIEQARRLIEPQQSLSRDSSSQPTSAIEFLPLILFCHESPEQLQHSLIPNLTACSPAQQTEVLTIASIVSLMLQEQFLHTDFGEGVVRLMSRLQESGSFPIEPEPEQVNPIQQIQPWLQDHTPLAMLPPIPLSPLTAALYGVLKTPASFQLALRQTLRFQPDPDAAALAGLLSGTYLSEAGLPIGWRYALDRHQSALLKALWGVSSTAELFDLSDRLWAVWSGAFQPQTWQSSQAASTVTAVPHLVRPR